MAQLISFLRANNGNSLKENITSHYNDFRSWLLTEDQESQMYYGKDYISPALRDFLNDNPELKRFDNVDDIVLDALKTEFVATFCDHGDGKRFYTTCGPIVSKWRYFNSTELIDTNCDEETKRIWKYLYVGRSLNNQPVPNLQKSYRVGFWTYEEQQYLLYAILRHFGSEENIRQKYWTDQEKEFFKKVISESSKKEYVLLTGFNPRSEGIELVLQLLRETINFKTEIVIGIE